MRTRAAIPVALAAALLAWPAGDASARSQGPAQVHVGNAVTKHSVTKHRRETAAERRARLHHRAMQRHWKAKRERAKLWAEFRARPQVFFTKRFRARAAAARFDMPMTVRLNPKIRADGNISTPATDAPSNDTLTVDWGTDPVPAPAGPGVGAGAQQSTLSGQFGITMRWGKDTIGYSTGSAIVEIGSAAVDLQATPVDVVDPTTACPDASPLLKTGPIQIAETPNWTRTGVLGLMGGPFRLRLYTSWTFNALRQGSFAGAAPSPFTDGCAGTFFWGDHVGLTAPPVPIDFVGTSSISPSLTTDGRLRLFIIHVHDATIPQDDLAATFHVCVNPDTAQIPDTDPAPATDCTGQAGNDTMIPATVKIDDFDAEVLVGSPD